MPSIWLKINDCYLLFFNSSAVSFGYSEVAIGSVGELGGVCMVILTVPCEDANQYGEICWLAGSEFTVWGKGTGTFCAKPSCSQLLHVLIISARNESRS